MTGENRTRSQVLDRVVQMPGGRRLWMLYAWMTTPAFVVSYPKSGRTWLRFALGQVICDHFDISPSRPSDVLEPHRLARVRSGVPRVRFTHDEPFLTATGHQDRSRRRFKRKRVVFLARDPRDVVVSSYHHHTRRSAVVGDPVFDGSLPEFLRDPVFGIESIVAFMNAWARDRAMPKAFLMVRYEDMIDDLEAQMRRIVEELGLPEVSDATLERAAHSSTFERMRALETSDALAAPAMRPSDPDSDASFKVRRGIVGGYVAELDASDATFADRVVEDRLDPSFGYTSRN